MTGTVHTPPISEPGWYRITAWETVTPEQAQAEIDAGAGDDLILVQDIRPGTRYLSSR